MEKKIRNAVRVFLIKKDKIVCIKYKRGPIGFIDIPGGKIEEKETKEEAAIREFLEETGMKISNLQEIGTMITEYPDRIYHFVLFQAHTYTGDPQNFEENNSFWIPISELLKEEKRFAITHLLDENYKKKFLEANIHVKYIMDENDKIIEIEKLGKRC